MEKSKYILFFIFWINVDKISSCFSSQQGIQTLFAESIANRRQMLSQALQQNNQSTQQDFTFLTSVGPTQNSHRTMGDAATEAIADEVMRNVADQMGLLNPLDIQMLEEHAKLPPR